MSSQRQRQVFNAYPTSSSELQWNTARRPTPGKEECE